MRYPILQTVLVKFHPPLRKAVKSLYPSPVVFLFVFEKMALQGKLWIFELTKSKVTWSTSVYLLMNFLSVCVIYWYPGPHRKLWDGFMHARKTRWLMVTSWTFHEYRQLGRLIEILSFVLHQTGWRIDCFKGWMCTRDCIKECRKRGARKWCH